MKMVGPLFKKQEKAFPKSLSTCPEMFYLLFNVILPQAWDIHKARGDPHQSLEPGPTTQWVGTYAHSGDPTQTTPLSYQTSFTNHKFKEKVIKNFRTVNTEHWTPSMRSWVQDPVWLCWSQAQEADKGWAKGQEKTKIIPVFCFEWVGGS